MSISKRKKPCQPVLLKLNLDLEELKPKYDCILPELFRALEHVKEPHVRGQFECLLSDVYNTFLQPEVEHQIAAQKASRFLDMIKNFMQDPTGNRLGSLSPSARLKGNRLMGISQLDKAKAISNELALLHKYFDGVVACLPAEELEGSACGSCKKTPSQTQMPDAFGERNKTSMIASLNKTQHCLNEDSGSSGTMELTLPTLRETSSIETSGTTSTTPLREDGGYQGITSQSVTMGDEDLHLIDRIMFDSNQSTCNKPLPFGATHCKETVLGPRSSAGGKLHNKRCCPQSMNNVRRMAEGVTPAELLMELPPCHTSNSATLVVKSRAGQCEQLNPCRKVMRFCDGKSPPVEASGGRAVGTPLERWSSFNFTPKMDPDVARRNPSSNRHGWCENTLSLSSSLLRVDQHGPRLSSYSGSCGVHADPALFRLKRLMAKVKAVGKSFQARRNRVDALKKSNAILEEQTTEVENTLKSFDNYLKTIKSKPFQIPPEALKREMYAFQEALIDTVSSCVEVLYKQIKLLRNTERKKSAKVRALLAQYETTKKKTPEAVIICDRIDKAASFSPHFSRTKPDCSGYVQSMLEVVVSIEEFQKTCEDIWDETMSRIATELDTLFMSLPYPPSKRWSPDNPISCMALSLPLLETLEDDVSTMTQLPADKSKYGAKVVFTLRVLERLSSEFGHLAVATRIKDLQSISVDHNIYMALMAIKQMKVAPLRKSPNQCVRADNRRNVESLASCDKKKVPSIKANKVGKVTLKSSELVKLERKVRRRLHPNTNIDHRMLKYRLNEGQEPVEDRKDARLANTKLLSAQLQKHNAHHMGAAADMKLPLTHLNDSRSLHRAGEKKLSASVSSGLTPWTYQKASGNSTLTLNQAEIHHGCLESAVKAACH